MSKGIRNYANASFAQLNVQRVAGLLSNKEFRAAVMRDIEETFDINNFSAASHYNFAFKQMKINAPEQVVGLGRAADKKGGRKRKVLVEVAKSGELNDSQVEFEVRKKKDDSVVASGLSFEDARTLVSKATAQKKAKLYWI